MDLSVILCTYNRAASLRQALDHLAQMTIPPRLTWELIVVDNNSTDATAAVSKEFVGRLPIRYLFEPQQGKGYAYNAGIRVAQGGLLLFTDDDAQVAPDWLGALWTAAGEHPEVGFIGGQVVPVWDFERPAWFDFQAIPELRNVIVNVQLPDDAVFSIDGSLPTGANMGFQRWVFDRVGQFRLDLGPKKRGGLLCDESDLCLRALRTGIPGRYVPRAIVYHPVAPERCTKRYVWDYQVRFARSWVLIRGLPESQHWICGMPRWMIRQLAQHASRLLQATLRGDEIAQVRHLIGLGFCWGQAWQTRLSRRAAAAKNVPESQPLPGA